MNTNTIEIKTPMGVLMAGLAGDYEHPGICISIKKEGERATYDIALVEYCDGEYMELVNKDHGGEAIMARLWSDPERDDPVFNIKIGLPDYITDTANEQPDCQEGANE